MRPEKVVNPYGSTAGANSGDFHLYRQTRAREMERMKELTEGEMERRKNVEFENKIKREREEEDKKTEKRRKKRQRHKEARSRRKILAKAGVKVDHDPDDEDDFEDDFAVPAPEELLDTEKSYGITNDRDSGGAQTEKESKENPAEPDDAPAPPFPNDGSFLEMIKKQSDEKHAEKD